MILLMPPGLHAVGRMRSRILLSASRPEALMPSPHRWRSTGIACMSWGLQTPAHAVCPRPSINMLLFAAVFRGKGVS